MLHDFTWLSFFELLSYVVTIISLPLAVFTLWNESRKERLNERDEIEQRDEEMYIELSKQYAEFLTLVLNYPSLDLLNDKSSIQSHTHQEEQQKIVLFEILIALFERAYILLYEKNMTHASSRRWHSWADYMQWWCKRADFCHHLEKVLEGEDPDFAEYMRKVIAEENP
jgi:hypothetical protein